MSNEVAKVEEGEGGPPAKKKMAGKTLILFIVLPAILLLGGGGAAAYFFIFAKKPAVEASAEGHGKEEKAGEHGKEEKEGGHGKKEEKKEEKKNLNPWNYNQQKVYPLPYVQYAWRGSPFYTIPCSDDKSGNIGSP